MARNHSIATRPGQSDIDVPFTQDEENAQDAAEAEELLQITRQQRRQEFREEGLRRIILQLPLIEDFDDLRPIASIWPSISGTASAEMLTAKDIWVYVKNTAIPAVNGATQTQLDAIDPTSDTPFGGQLPGWPSA